MVKKLHETEVEKKVKICLSVSFLITGDSYVLISPQ